jgi:mono/diheme cytochrome c family protein
MRATYTGLGIAAVLGLLTAAGCSEASGPETPIEGKRLYDQYCARCHGEKGYGVAGEHEPGSPELAAKQNPINNAARLQGLSEQAMLGVLRAGRPPIQENGPPMMPGFAGEFTEAKLMVIAAYVRSLPETYPSPDAEAQPQE